ncbi:hypothetical protein QUB28_05675 [Microcoleus sp. B4-C3]
MPVPQELLEMSIIEARSRTSSESRYLDLAARLASRVDGDCRCDDG